MQKKIFLICPVRNADPKTQEFLAKYVRRVERLGHKIHYPARDTNQVDSIGLRICTDNRGAIRNSDEVHILFDPTSQGTLFDIGVAFQLEKPIRLINRHNLQFTEKKSFQNVLMTLHDKYSNERRELFRSQKQKLKIV